MSRHIKCQNKGNLPQYDFQDILYKIIFIIEFLTKRIADLYLHGDYGKHFLPRTLGLVIDTDGLTSQIKCRLLRWNPFILGTTDYADRWIRWEGKVYPQSRADSLSLRTYGWIIIIISNPFCVTRPHGQRVPTTLIRVHPLRPASRNSVFVFSQIL